MILTLRNIFVFLSCAYGISVAGQVTVSPRLTINHNYYEWNNKGLGGFTDVREWTWGIGLISRAKLGDKMYANISFYYYPSGHSFTDNRAIEPNTIKTNLFDTKIGLEYQLYPKTLLGIGIELEMLTQVRRQGIFNPEPLIAGNQTHYGFEASLSQRVWKIELFADVFIGINEIANQGTGLLDPAIFFRSHKKLQFGIGIPFGMK